MSNTFLRTAAAPLFPATRRDARVGELDSETVANVATIASIAGAGLGAYHGYKRNQSVGWAIGWGIFGGALPILALPIAFAQGFGKRG